MYRGTTPTITINCDIDVSEFVTMWVTFRTQQLATYAPPKQVEVTKHLGDEGVDATDKVVTVSLTQADTLLLGSLSPDEDQQVEVQIRGRTEDGRAFASNIMTAPLSRILKDGVTKEQVIGDVSFENATASANGKVTVTLSAAPSNPILVIITSIAL